MTLAQRVFVVNPPTFCAPCFFSSILLFVFFFGMHPSRAIATNTIVQSMGKIVSVALGWGVVVMMTRALGASGFGEYTIMTAFLHFFGVAVDFGFVLVSSQLLAEREEDQEKVFANLLTFRFVTALAIVAIAPAVIWLFPYSVVVKQGVVILSLSFFFAALMQVFTGFYQKELKMGRVLLGEIVSRLILIGGVWHAIATGRGLLYMMVAVVVGALANLLILVFLAGGKIRFRFAYDAEIWRLIWRRAWPLMLTIILNLIYLKADTVILSFVRSEAEVGIYGAMYRVFEVLVTFPTMFAGLLLPILSAARARGDSAGFQKTASDGLAVLIYAIVPMVIGILFTAPMVAQLFGADFAPEGATLLRLLVLANAAVFLGTYFAHLVVAADQQKKMIVPFAITAAVGLIGYLIFIPRYGAYGAASMTFVSEAIIAILAYGVARRAMGASLVFVRPFFIALVASIPMMLWLWFASSLFVVVTAVVSFLLYSGMLLLLGVVPRTLMSGIMLGKTRVDEL